MSAPTDRMTPEERRAGASLASIFALRMLGLFLILPVFSVYAKTLPGGDNLALVGFALGAYGLTQAFFQIPYGIASDYFGRKLVIVIGLLIFALGSFVAAWAPDMTWIIVGRVLQGAGAISAAVTALAADLTREEHRTKVMAMIGSSIGLVFALSLVGAPLLYGWIGMGGLFIMTGVLALAAIVLLLKAVPPAPPPHGHEKLPLRRVIFDADLLRLNLGIFVLHMVQMAMFVVLPHALVDYGGLAAAAHWKVYLPAVLVSFAIMVPAIIAAERKDKILMIWASRHFQKGNPQNLLRPSDLMRILVPWRAFGDLATAQRLVPEHEAQLIREVEEQRDARLADIEDAFRLWRFRHLTTVERVIGFKRGTGGTGGVSYLRKMLDVVLFPEIWKLRTDL